MYGLIGRPLGHSFSASFFNEKFERENINEVYKLFPLPSIEDVIPLIEETPALHGLNVTIPYKQEILQFLSYISPEAKEIGAVNVVRIKREANKFSLEGFNSDAVGFRNSICPLLRSDMKKALLLGTGGASKAVEYVLSQMGIEVIKVSRKTSDVAISYDTLTADIINDCKIIINATPLGMWPNIDAAPPIPYSAISPAHLLYDLVYNPELTKFMKEGLKMGAIVKNGLEMLYGQAVEAWRIWNE